MIFFSIAFTCKIRIVENYGIHAVANNEKINRKKIFHDYSLTTLKFSQNIINDRIEEMIFSRYITYNKVKYMDICIIMFEY